MFKNFSALRAVAVCAAVFAFSILPIAAQDGEPVVIDEVVAQVNDGVITLSRVRREMNFAIEALVKQGKKTPEDAQRELEAKRPELIASLITEELLQQQGKEMGLEQEVEQSVNEELTAIMRQLNLKTLEELYKAMREQGEDPESFKAFKRKQYMTALVYRYGVDAKIYNGVSDREVRAYFDKNSQKFKKPETVTLSEIFLSFAGRPSEDAVKTEAAEIIKKARGGADWTALVNQYSDHADTKAKKGVVGTFETANLNEQITTAVKEVKAGGIAEPIRLDEGLMILRVDERVADSNTPTFDERRVREAMTYERSPGERRKYVATLRQDAYIKIAAGYEPAVSQALKNIETDK